LILVDTNVLLDVATNDAVWADWSFRRLEEAAVLGPVVVNPVIYAEFSVGYQRLEDVERILAEVDLDVVEIPREALFLAGKAFQAYRRQGGGRTGVLPDFFIGAHAVAAGMTLLTRDAGRYPKYFPTLRLVSPA
jgi:predicted nucleic acid-binding protein